LTFFKILYLKLNKTSFTTS